MFAKINYFRSGMIQAWAGAIADIPAGWVLCNGSNGTPDMRNRFLCGAGTTYAPDDTGGNYSHTHTGNTTHTHELEDGQKVVINGGSYAASTGPPKVPGITGSATNAPLYHALAYIMKL